MADITTKDLLDMKRINELRSLDGEESFLDDLIELFKSEAMHSMNELAIAVASNEAASVRSIAHRIKGASASLGAAKMASIAGTIEISNSNELPSLLGELRMCYEMTVTELANS